MLLESAEDTGKLLIRLTVGLLLLFHAYGFSQGDPGIPSTVAAWGLPKFTAYVGFLLEVIGSVLVILGVYTRIGGWMITLYMVAALLMYHTGELEGVYGSGSHFFMLGKNAAGTHFDKYFLEPQMFYLMNGLAVALLGRGRFGLGKSGRWD